MAPMRVVSMVPSWTETLIHCGVEVVGRTRFCLYPAEKVKAIPVVGGTKDWHWEKIQALRPDLILLDQEENPKIMAEQSSFPFLATHITGIADMPAALNALGQALRKEEFAALAERWEKILRLGPLPPWKNGAPLPGLHEWGQEPRVPIEKVLYIIWKNPWMAAGSGTFISSMLRHCGILLTPTPEKYPVVDQEMHSLTPSTLVLFSSEPYPFLRKKKELAGMPSPYAFLDGESYSWFGLRSLEFLESLHGIAKIEQG